MGKEQNIDEEELFVSETKILFEMSVKDREKYVYDMLGTLSVAVDDILKTKGKILMAKKWTRFNEELKQKVDGEMSKGEIIVTCALYAIKPKYRPVFVKLLALITGMEEKINV